MPVSLADLNGLPYPALEFLAMYHHVKMTEQIIPFLFGLDFSI